MFDSFHFRDIEAPSPLRSPSHSSIGIRRVGLFQLDWLVTAINMSRWSLHHLYARRFGLCSSIHQPTRLNLSSPPGLYTRFVHPPESYHPFYTLSVHQPLLAGYPTIRVCTARAGNPPPPSPRHPGYDQGLGKVWRFYRGRGAGDQVSLRKGGNDKGEAREVGTYVSQIDLKGTSVLISSENKFVCFPFGFFSVCFWL